MSLEVDHRDNLPILQQPHKEVYSEKSSQSHVYPAINNQSPGPATMQQRAFWKSPVLLLSIALAIVTILAAIAAGVGGSIAVQRKNEIDNLRSSLDKATQSLGYENGTSGSNTGSAGSNNLSTCTNTSSSDTASVSSITDLQPTTNCTAIGDGNRYVSAWTKATFTVHCATDYPGSDVLGIWTFTFADCIEACASWNKHQNSPQCYAVTYDIGDRFTEERGEGNCFLKESGSITAEEKNVTSSAQANFSGGS
ncbi:MAG: hypothetical protein Q9225_002723 [Loekoesia sp. 1 TL-2023]